MSVLKNKDLCRKDSCESEPKVFKGTGKIRLDVFYYCFCQPGNVPSWWANMATLIQ